MGSSGGVSVSRSPFIGGFLGAFLQPLITKVGGKAARYILIGLGLGVALFVRWWQQQTTLVHVLLVVGLLGLAGAWASYRWRHRAQLKPVGSEPTQVLYRWWEPDDLKDRMCYCGKTRVPGELIYIGITGAHRSRELDDDRQASCWWREGLVGTTQTYRTRDDVERAERRAIRSERPRENKQHAVGR